MTATAIRNRFTAIRVAGQITRFTSRGSPSGENLKRRRRIELGPGEAQQAGRGPLIGKAGADAPAFFPSEEGLPTDRE
jgi:hypothetical protein